MRLLYPLLSLSGRQDRTLPVRSVGFSSSGISRVTWGSRQGEGDLATPILRPLPRPRQDKGDERQQGESKRKMMHQERGPQAVARGGIPPADPCPADPTPCCPHLSAAWVLQQGLEHPLQGDGAPGPCRLLFLLALGVLRMEWSGEVLSFRPRPLFSTRREGEVPRAGPTT